MIEKIKKLANWIFVLVIGFLGLLLGIERWRRKGAERREEEAKAKAEKSETEKKGAVTARNSQKEVSEKLSVKDQRDAERIKEVATGKTSYNDLVDDWNNSGMQ